MKQYALEMRGWLWSSNASARTHLIIRPLSIRIDYIIQFIDLHHPQSASSICQIIIISGVASQATPL